MEKNQLHMKILNKRRSKKENSNRVLAKQN